MKGHLVEIVLHALLTENRVSNHAAADISDVQAIGARLRENKIGGLAPAAAVHVFMHEAGIAGNVLAQEGYQRFHAQITGSSRRGADDHSDRLTLVEWRLGVCAIPKQSHDEPAGAEKNPTLRSNFWTSHDHAPSIKFSQE